MSYSAKVICDSISPTGKRLTTLEVVMPRIVLAEFNTHRWFSRNSASSRAIPIEKQIQRVLDHPFIPTYFGKAQKGMQADEELTGDARVAAEDAWLRARDSAIQHARTLLDLNVHKQLANRLLEPFLWHTVIVTATEWDNWDARRASRLAQPEIRIPAELMIAARRESTPHEIAYGDWHMPYATADEMLCDYTTGHCNESEAEFEQRWCKISIARCARVSYLTHDGVRDPSKDVELCDQLLKNGHMSPFEHVATPAASSDTPSGNFLGWTQYRKGIPNEACIPAEAS